MTENETPTAPKMNRKKFEVEYRRPPNRAERRKAEKERRSERKKRKNG
jgi:hypothetical protein